jgi:hypothetical protein
MSVALSVVNSLTQTANQTAVTGTVNDPIVGLASNPIIPGNGSITVPVGTTAQRVLNQGAIRLNTTTGFFECSTDGATWVNLATGGGGISTINGTVNRISVVTVGPTATVNIDAAYVGQASITTLGTITTGVWNGTNVPLNHGGTNAALVASNGGIIYSTAGAMAVLAGTATAAQILMSGASSAPNWSTATYPLNANANQLLYGVAPAQYGQLATANNGALVTSGAGVPSISSTLPAAVQGNITATGALASGSLAAGFTPVTVPLGGTGNTTFTAYSVICAGTTATGTFQNVVGVGTNGYVLTSNGAGALPTWQSTGAVTGVASVSGTAGQIVATPTTGNVVVSIDPAYVGQSSITTLGTITTGVWHGSIIPLAYGGTNANLTASNGGIFYSTATAGAILAGTATANQMLQSGSSTTPAWSTSTWPATTTINQLLYSSSNNVVAGLASAANGVLITSAGSAPSISSTLPAAVQGNITTVGTIGTGVWQGTPVALAYGGTNANLTASNGGIFYSTATAGAILAGTATAGQLLTSGASTTPAWTTSTYPATNAANTLLYASSANTMAALATANSGTLVTSASGVPSLLALGAQQSLVGVASGTPAVANIPGQNMLINGDFQVWQRGAGGSATFGLTNATGYTADRWQCNSGGAGTATTFSQSAGATSGSFLMKVQRNNASAGTDTITASQSLTRDMCIGSAGNVVTLSFKAKSGANFSSAGGLITIQVQSGTGTTDVSNFTTGFMGGATSVLSTTQAITSTLTNYKFTTTTLGSTVTQLYVSFAFNGVGAAGADDSFSITDVQLEISPNQTPFQRRSFGDEQALCQRFYRKSLPYAFLPSQNNTGGITFGAQGTAAVNNTSPMIAFHPDMLKTPSITLYNPNAANAQARDISTGADCSSTATAGATTSGFYVTTTGDAGALPGYVLSIAYQADADVT